MLSPLGLAELAVSFSAETLKGSAMFARKPAPVVSFDALQWALTRNPHRDGWCNCTLCAAKFFNVSPTEMANDLLRSAIAMSVPLD